MKIESGISNTGTTERIATNLTEFYTSRFAFLREFRGLRPHYVHCLLGMASAGKSTLLKSIVADTIKKAPCLLWLSEEERDFYSKGIIDSFIGDMSKAKRNLLWFEESNEENRTELSKIGKNWKKAADYIIDVIIQSSCRVVFFDNITTSKLYEDFCPQDQSNIIGEIRAFTEKSGIVFFFLAHTQKGINSSLNRLLTTEDVQGSSGVSKKVECFFVLQTFEIENKKLSFINITKSRPIEGGVSSRFFNLSFSVNHYIGDKACSFEIIKEAFKLRNTLEGKINEKNKGRF